MIPSVGDLVAVLVVLILLAVATLANRYMDRRRAAFRAEFNRKRAERASEHVAQEGDL